MTQGGADRSDVFVLRGCRFPRGLIYDVPNHVWYEPADEGKIRVGMTVIAAALASNRIFAVTPKRPGRELEAGRACATIESSKWVGPARIAFDGAVAEVNQDLIDNPGKLVSDPYGEGWMLIANAKDVNALDPLVTGDAAVAAYDRWMHDNDFPGCNPPDP